MDAVIKKVGIVTEKNKRTFWRKVDIGFSDMCWEWQGTISTGGYGFHTLHKQTWLAHRLAWFLTHGEQTTKFLLHYCDNRRCVNPNHLHEGDHQQNATERVERDRSAKGEQHGRSKLTESDIPNIERLALVENWSEEQIAAKYGLNRSSISHILRGDNWKHVPRLFQKTSRAPKGGSISFHKRAKKYHVRITVNGRRVDCGYHATLEKAEEVRREMLDKCSGSVPNSPNEFLLSNHLAA